MRFERVFWLSIYMTLALASLCLAAAEEFFLPGTIWFFLPIAILLGVTFVLEGRWWLSLVASNVLGLAIAVGALGWIGYNLVAPFEWFVFTPWPYALLPLAGPVLMVVQLAKVFRPKQISDVWALHLIGLVEVSLACLLTGEPIIGLLLLAYLTCSLWSLMLFSLYRKLSKAKSDPQSSILNPRSSILAGWGVWWTGRRVLVIAALGLMLFLLTPRNGKKQWNLLAGNKDNKQETGYTTHVDLNSSGKVEMNREVALEVYVQSRTGQPKLDLNPAQRWRGATMDYYDKGQWLHRHLQVPSGEDSSNPPIVYVERNELPNLGPEEFLVTFHVDLSQAGGLFLADPVVFQPRATKVPVRALRQISWTPYLLGRDSSLFIMPFSGHPRRYRYQQVTLPEEDHVPPAVELQPPYEKRLLDQPLPRLRSWTQEIVRQLVAEGRLQEDDLAEGPEPREGADRARVAKNRAKVARVLSAYLASGKDFTYRLETRRQDFSLDPIEDFLFHVKQGFCEQFATGLVFMLRSVGIPARLVLGFRGADTKNINQEGDGWYVIRQSHAHSWVEALVARPGPGGQPESYWLTLDPTPAEATSDSQGFSWLLWWQNTQESFRDGWKTMILDYNLEMQSDALTALWNGLALKERFQTIDAARTDRQSRTGGPWVMGGALAAVPLLLLLGWWLRRRLRFRRRQVIAARPPAVAFYQRWLDLVWRHYQLQPRPSQTSWEFAQTVNRGARPQAAAGLVAEVSFTVVRLYYQVRYDLRPPKVGEVDALDRQVQNLDVALTRNLP